MEPTGTLTLLFDPAHDPPGKRLRDGLSAVAHTPPALWVANDESQSLERLLPDAGDPGVFRADASFALSGLLALPTPPDPATGAGEEIDIEGMAVADGFLWLVGSHSLKRKAAQPLRTAAKNIERLANTDREPNRCLLARVPLLEGPDGVPTLAARVPGTATTPPRQAARLRADAHGSQLTHELAGDAHLGAFLKIPGKDNGFDIEGLAVLGERVFLGLRGPVLRGMAIVLEIRPVERPVPAPGQGVELRLEDFAFAPGCANAAYRKHFLALGGLGVRDLRTDGPDLLVLAGPTMDLDGPAQVFRWRGGPPPDAESVVFPGVGLEEILDLPVGRGDDHPEGLALFAPSGGGPAQLLVVHDTPAPARRVGDDGLRADLYEKPPA